MRNYGTREAKAQARARMLEGVRTASTVVTLPGVDLACVREMQERGIIGPDTQQIWFERDTETFEHIRSLAFMAYPEARLMNGEILLWEPDARFDLLNLDLEESFTPSLGHWLEKRASGSFADLTTLIVTLTANPRNRMPSEFARWFDARSEIDPALRGVLLDLIGKSRTQSRPLMRSILMTLCTLPDFACRIETADEYAEPTPMVTFRIVARRAKVGAGLPRMSELLDEFRQGYVGVSVPERAQARRLADLGLTSGPTRPTREPRLSRAPYIARTTTEPDQQEQEMTRRTLLRNAEREALLRQIGRHQNQILDLQASLRALDEQEQAEAVRLYAGQPLGPTASKAKARRVVKGTYADLDEAGQAARRADFRQRHLKASATKRRLREERLSAVG